MRRAALTTALLAGACALPLGSAQAATVASATYDVQFEGVYHYNATESGEGVMDATRAVDLGFDSTTATPVNLSRSETSDTSVAETAPPVVSLDGTYNEVIYGHPVVHQDCTLALDGAPSPGIAGASTAADGTVTVDVRPFDQVDGLYTCSQGVSDPHVPFPGGWFDVKVTVPAAQVGDASIAVAVESPASLPCPGYGFTTSCDASWSGRVTLTRRSVTNAPEPARPASGTPAPGTPGGIPLPPLDPARDGWADGIELPPLVPAVETKVPPYLSPPGEMRWDAARGVLEFEAACAGGCTGTATLAVAGGGAHASASASAAARRTKAIRFTVPKSTRKRRVRVRLGRHAKGRLTLVLRDRRSHRTTAVKRTLR